MGDQRQNAIAECVCKICVLEILSPMNSGVRGTLRRLHTHEQIMLLFKGSAEAVWYLLYPFRTCASDSAASLLLEVTDEEAGCGSKAGTQAAGPAGVLIWDFLTTQP